MSLDLPVGRYFYYYKVVFDTGIVENTDGERMVLDRDNKKMNSIHVRVADRENGEEEQKQLEEKQRSKIRSALEQEVKDVEVKKTENDEDGEGENEKSRARRSTVMKDQDAIELEERLARRERRLTMKKEKEKDERQERLEKLSRENDREYVNSF